MHEGQHASPHMAPPRGANPRLERMCAALDKFLELIDHKAK